MRDATAPGAAPMSARWRRSLVALVVGVDVAGISIVFLVMAWAGVTSPAFGWNPVRVAGVSVVALLLVLALMAVFRCWEPRVLGQGADEFNRVLRAFVSAVLLLALAGMAVKQDAVRPWLFGVLPAAGAWVLVVRWVIRRALHRARRRGACMSSVLVVGTDEAIADLTKRTARVPHHGWTVVAACTSTGAAQDGSGEVLGVPVVGDLDGVAGLATELGVSVVAVAPAPGWSSKRLHRLAWELEGTAVELVVDPGLMEVAGPRLHVAPVDGLPLLMLTEPRFGGPARVAKSVVDRGAAALLLLFLAPLFLVVGLGIRADGGPAFFRQTRVGRKGQLFRMIKFRSMVIDADQVLDRLRERNDGAGPLFKMVNDPRVTRIGAVLRRFSLDELPQLINVLTGSMSLVGPRPALPAEVSTYADDALRKLVVRPGMTGLWQVSGRSDLSWEESVRLDLRYVENWSPALDAMVLWKTLGAVFRGRGAY